MESITIRKITAADLEALQAIGRQTFYETFAAVNTEENMSRYLAEGFADKKLLAELEAPGAEFYFAEEAGTVIGYLKLNTGAAQTEVQGSDALEIERIYVAGPFHGKGVGQVLYEKALQRAREQGLGFVWLGVWEENRRALRFYEKNGFVAFGQHVFRLGNDEQTDILMKLSLR